MGTLSLEQSHNILSCTSSEANYVLEQFRYFLRYELPASEKPTSLFEVYWCDFVDYTCGSSAFIDAAISGGVDPTATREALLEAFISAISIYLAGKLNLEYVHNGERHTRNISEVFSAGVSPLKNYFLLGTWKNRSSLFKDM